MEQFQYPLVLEWKINHDIFIHTTEHVKTMKINNLYAKETNVTNIILNKRLTRTCFHSLEIPFI